MLLLQIINIFEGTALQDFRGLFSHSIETKHMRFTYHFLLLFSGIFILNACKKEKPLDAQKELMTYVLEESKNVGFLSQDVQGVFEANTIHLLLPHDTKWDNLIATFTYKGRSITVKGEEQVSGVTARDFSKEIRYLITAEDGSYENYTVKATLKDKEKVSAVPHIYINTENGARITSKEDYLNANIKIDGKGGYNNYEGTTRIKGRGNTTWYDFPKKPYRLKLDKSAELLGLSAEKDWILLANYMDGTLMLNAIAMKIGKLLEMPFTNTMLPVDVTINGSYMGNYMFTEHKEVEKNRINVGDGGVLLELDSYFDEPFKFISTYYQLPVMIAYPELEDYAPVEASSEFSRIRNDFYNLEKAINSFSFPNNNYLDLIDAKSIVNYLIVYNLCQNEEINHPKSVYMHQPKGGKYAMGPIWDFDWAFDYEDNYRYFTNFTKPLFWTGNKALVGTHFFSRFLTDPALQVLYKNEWKAFRNNKFTSLIQYLDEYAVLIEESQAKDYAVWKRGSGNFKADVLKLRTWLYNRAGYIDSMVESF